MSENELPTAEFGEFDKIEEAEEFINKCNWSGIVVKADGLAAGKGVVVASNKEDAKQAARSMLQNKPVRCYLQGVSISGGSGRQFIRRTVTSYETLKHYNKEKDKYAIVEAYVYHRALSVSYEVTVRRMNCLPDPPEIETPFEPEVGEEVIRVLGKAINGTEPLGHEGHLHTEMERKSRPESLIKKKKKKNRKQEVE